MSPSSVASADTPQGMAIGPAHDVPDWLQLEAGRRPNVVMIDERNGKILATVANESGSDEVWFDPGNNHCPGSSGAGADRTMACKRSGLSTPGPRSRIPALTV